MKRVLLLTTLVISLASCHQAPSPEQPATIIELTLPGPTVFCACCAGYKIQVGSQYYYTNSIPLTYDKPNTPIWIRYQADTDHCKGKTDRIELISIRSR